VFSGVRIKEAISHVKRIYEAKDEPGFDLIKPAMDQLTDITNARNDILHYGAKFIDGEPKFVTNKRIAHKADRARQFPVSAEILGRMTADLAGIVTQIDFYLSYGAMPQIMFQGEFRQAFSEPWQYKHAPLTGSQDEALAPQARKSPPPPSRG
jgi:hypothetical protein